MLHEYLTAHPLEVRCVPQFPPAADRAAWESVPAEDCADLLSLAEDWRKRPYPLLTAGMYAAFIRTGSRRDCEAPYFARRVKLIAHAMHVCLTGTNGDLPQVEDGLVLLCEETVWAISAHANLNADHPFPKDDGTPIVDLFAAQTGMILSFICALLADRLQPDLTDRVRREVERRVLQPFMENDGEWWMGFIRKDLNNWTPWVVSNVLMAANVWDFRLNELIPRACGMLERWLLCVPEDGGCDEGAGYWNMAAGAFLDCLMLLESVCGMDLWADEKVRRMMAYPERVHLADGWFANFADCDARPFISGERLQYAGERTGNAALVRMGAAMRGSALRELNDVPHLSRLLMRLFRPAATVASVPHEPKDVYLPDLQVRIAEKGRYILCGKGGHNAESHNHNDVGSFMVMAEGRMQVVDAGNMVYTAKTFSDRRYELWNCRSLYHNVPVIGEREQRPGREFAARSVAQTADGLTLDFAPAYPAEAGVAALHRAMSVSEQGVTVEDEIVLNGAQPVTWVFMLSDEPVVAGNVSRGRETGFAIRWDEALAASVERIDVTDARMRKSYPDLLWRLTLTVAPHTHHQQTFLFS